MKRIIFAVGLAALLFSPALAADLAVKAPASSSTASGCQPATATTPLSCSGLYVGGGIAGENSNANILGNGVNGSIFAGGVSPTLDVGYQYMQGNWMFAAELDASYVIGSNASFNGVPANANGFKMTELFKVGGNLSSVLGINSQVTVPPSLANALLMAYVAEGATQWWLSGSSPANGNVTAAGFEWDFNTHWIGDLRYEYTNYNGAKALGLTLQNDQTIKLLVNYKF